MGKQLVEFGDPERAIIDYLDGAYTPALADRKPTTFDVDPPSRTLSGSATWLQVETDGTPVTEQLAERATVRCTVHTAPGRRSAAKDTAALVGALMRAHPGDDVVWTVQPLVGQSRPLVDPPTKNLMVWMTFRVTLRPLKVAAS